MSWLALVLLLYPATASAHASAAIQDVLGWYAVILGNLFILSFLYVRGWSRKARHETRPPIFFLLGILAVLFALLPPIDLLSEELLSIHMIQHMLLMMVAAPLFVFSYSDFFIRIGFSERGRRRLWKVQRRLTGHGLQHIIRPLLIAGLYALVLWIWHLPFLYESALRSRWVHNAQHLLFFIGSYFFWKVLLRRIGKPALNSAAGIIYLFVTSLHTTALGVLMAVSPQIWYPFYAGTTAGHGLTAIEDQQLAGYIMWMPAGFSYVIIAAWLTLRLVQEPRDVIS